MKWIQTLARTGVVAAAAVAGMSAAQAAVCGLTGTSVTSLGNIDPFAPSGTSVANFNLNLTRVNLGSAKTQSVLFFLQLGANDPPITVTYNGQPISYQSPTVPAGFAPYTGNQPAGVTYENGALLVGFGGAAQPDTISVPLSVTIPANADLTSGLPITFDVRYYCQGTGQLDSVQNPPGGLDPDAVTLTVNVLSALQASYVGAALAFGEIGDLTTAGLGAAGTGRTRRTGDIRVRSSGPYTVAMTSQNGYYMTYPGNSGLASQKINYRLSFLDQVINGAAATTAFTTVTCLRAGVPLPGQLLGIQADLLEGGQGKAPSPNYQDILTITVTPLVSGSGTDCQAKAP